MKDAGLVFRELGCEFGRRISMYLLPWICLRLPFLMKISKTIEISSAVKYSICELRISKALPSETWRFSLAFWLAEQ